MRELQHRNAKLEKVAGAAKARRALCPHKFIPETEDEPGWDECCTHEGCGLDYDNCAALAELEAPDDPR
jgi:hypothetical protein